MLDPGDISERMYEAAFLPEMWTPLLDELAVTTKSGVGGIGIYWPVQRGISTTFHISPGKAVWEQSPEKTKHWLAHVRSGPYINRGFFQIDPMNGDWSDLPDFEQRLEYHKSRGFGAQTASIIELFDGEIVTIEFTRRISESRYEDETINGLNGIHSAFRQSVFFASRLQFERARSSIATLNDFGLPAALLGRTGRILHSNDLFESIEPYTFKSPSGQISLRGSDNLRKTFAQALERSVTKSVSLAIPAGGTRNGAVIHLMPMCRDARAIFSMSCIVMVVAPVAMTAGVPPPDLAAQLFGLTRAEARLAVTLASGLSLRDSAAHQDITVGTARSYLIRIFSKTATSQQSELVSLLKSIPGQQGT